MIYDTFSRTGNIYTIVSGYSKKYDNGSYPRELSENFPIYGISTRDLMLMFSQRRFILQEYKFIYSNADSCLNIRRENLSEMTMGNEEFYKTILEYKIDGITRATISPINYNHDSIVNIRYYQ